MWTNGCPAESRGVTLNRNRLVGLVAGFASPRQRVSILRSSTDRGIKAQEADINGSDPRGRDALVEAQARLTPQH